LYNPVASIIRSGTGMGLIIRTGSRWNPESAAFCGGCLGAAGVMLHEVYTVAFGLCLPIDPFTHVLAELAVFAPGGAILFAVTSNARNWLVRENHSAPPLLPNLPTAGRRVTSIH
jgi:hypothetical protein